jgi:hypothetical protein
MLVGPFDFKPVTKHQKRQNVINSEFWDELLMFSDTVDISTVDEVDPLK